jgi:Double zinc ribbon
MINLRKIASKKKRAFTTKIENIVRQEFGIRNVGEGWVSETILYQIVKRIFIKEEVLRHDRPDWLEGLELDIFVPSLNLAFEYQGQQHFHPIRLWGGSQGLQDLQERDSRKAKLCASCGIDLIAIDYTEPLTEDYIYRILEERGYPQQRRFDNERNMDLDTKSCPFCKTQASINARFCKKCSKPL